ncbi:MAG: hypothetical protein WC497_00565 [Patescibacteria group bacterium]
MARLRIKPINGIIILLLLAIGGGYGIYTMASVTDQAQLGLRVISRNIPSNGNAAGEANTYVNTQYGIQLTQPDGWNVVETTPIGLTEAALTVTLTDPLSTNRMIFSILQPSMKETLRSSLSIESEGTAMLGTLTAEKWVGEDQKDGSPVTIVTAESNGRLYEVTSYAPAETLDSFLSAFKIVQ